MVTAVALLAPALFGQEFEVASIKPNNSLSGHSGTHSDRGMLNATNVSLRSLILMAYRIRDYQLQAPSWLADERFDIAAKLPADMPEKGEAFEAAFTGMIRRMLEDRFHLAAHREQKTMTVYGLMQTKTGIKFKKMPGATGNSSNSSNSHYKGSPVTMARFAEFLSGRADLPVIDMTRLSGGYEVELTWVPDDKAGEVGPSLKDALQDQLGLRLETQKAPIEIVVIDRIDREPTEN